MDRGPRIAAKTALKGNGGNFSNASQFVMFYDSLGRNRRGYGFETWWYDWDYWNKLECGAMRWPHVGRTINLVFVDGHVKNLREAEVTDSIFNAPDGSYP